MSFLAVFGNLSTVNNDPHSVYRNLGFRDSFSIAEDKFLGNPHNICLFLVVRFPMLEVMSLAVGNRSTAHECFYVLTCDRSYESQGSPQVVYERKRKG